MVSPFNTLTSRAIDALPVDEAARSKIRTRPQAAPAAREAGREEEMIESRTATQPKVMTARIKRLMKADY